MDDIGMTPESNEPAPQDADTHADSLTPGVPNPPTPPDPDLGQPDPDLGQDEQPTAQLDATTRPIETDADLQVVGQNGAQEPPAPEPYRPPYATVAPVSALPFRAGRRRRRYAMYLRRTSRARAAARSATIARVTWASVIALAVVTLAVIVTTVGAAAAYYQSQEVSVLALSRTVASRDSLRIYDRNGTLLYQLNNGGEQHSIPIAQIPITVVNATISIEDHTFWTNPGIDATSIVRAFEANYSSGTISQGGSTITQQLIKQNILGGSVNYTRKLQEAILAVGMTETGTYTKQQILDMYLNSIDYGHEAYGIESAAQVYFDLVDNPKTGVTAAQQLDLAQASMLAGIPQNPNLNDPIAHFATAHARQQTVLNDMVQYGYITRAQAAAAYAEAAQPNFFKNITNTVPNLAPAFVDYVIQQLQGMVSNGQLDLSRSGLNVYTTLDLDLQNEAQAAAQKHVYGNDRDDYGSYIKYDHLTNTAGIMVDNGIMGDPGAIRVMMGSVNYYSTSINGQFNVVTEGYRPSGSSFKPIAYATAFNKGWFPAMTIADTPTIFWDSGSQSQYRPVDFGFTWDGEMTLRQALQTSRNIPALKVMQYAGVQNVEQMAIRMGLRTWEGTWGLSSVLGTLDVTPFEMAQMYSVLANDGQYYPMYAIQRITDSATNTVLYQYQTPAPVQVMSPQIAYMVTNVLEDNYSRDYKHEFGECSPLYLDPLTSPDGPDFIRPNTFGPIGTAECNKIYAGHGVSQLAWPSAVKTGTAADANNNTVDDWTIGYTPQFTMAVWAGNNDHSPMRNIDGVTGAAPTWNRVMLYAMQRGGFPLTNSGNHRNDFLEPKVGLRTGTWTSNGITSTDIFLAGPLPDPNTGSGGSNIQVCFPQNGTGWIPCPTAPAPSPAPGGGPGGPSGSPAPNPSPKPNPRPGG